MILLIIQWLNQRPKDPEVAQPTSQLAFSRRWNFQEVGSSASEGWASRVGASRQRAFCPPCPHRGPQQGWPRLKVCVFLPQKSGLEVDPSFSKQAEIPHRVPSVFIFHLVPGVITLTTKSSHKTFQTLWTRTADSTSYPHSSGDWRLSFWRALLVHIQCFVAVFSVRGEMWSLGPSRAPGPFTRTLSPCLTIFLRSHI